MAKRRDSNSTDDENSQSDGCPLNKKRLKTLGDHIESEKIEFDKLRSLHCGIINAVDDTSSTSFDTPALSSALIVPPSKFIDCSDKNIREVTGSIPGEGSTIGSQCSVSGSNYNDLCSNNCKDDCNSVKDTVISIAISSNEKDTTYSTLMGLSDDVLLIIFKNLHPGDLLALSRTCQRLHRLCHDRTLWAVIDFRHNDISRCNVSNLNDYIQFLLPTTRTIILNGFTLVNGRTSSDYSCLVRNDENDCTSEGDANLKLDESQGVWNIHNVKTLIDASFFYAITEKTEDLVFLGIEHLNIDGTQVIIENFPSTLEVLSLKDSFIYNLPTNKSYFLKIDNLLPRLKVLDLTGCTWFQPHSLLALSKSSTLTELYLARCSNMEDCVPYASLAAIYGFPSLELLDLRYTYVDDSDVSCFNHVKKLKKLYLQAPQTEGGDSKISDVGIASFGGSRVINANLHGDEMGLPFLFIHNQRMSDSDLEHLVLRNYRSITDISLKHAASCLPKLKHLDISGAGCTEHGVRVFRNSRPDVELVTDFVNTQVLNDFLERS